MVSLEELKESGVKEGSRLEITLFEGAEYYDGSTPAPTTNMQGFDPCEEMKKTPGRKVSGYVRELKTIDLTEDGMGVIEEIIMHSLSEPVEHPHRMSTWYVDAKCIHSYQK
jgi:hypothetical protein